MRTALLLAACAAAIVPLTGCESTVDAAKKISSQGIKAFQGHGLTVGHVDRHIRIISSAVVHDANGTAAIIALRNSGSQVMTDTPIAIDVRDAAGRSVFENDQPGLENDLSHVPLLPPGKVVDWVNDQVLPTGTAARVAARIGAGHALHAALPKITIGTFALTDDPASGWEAVGTVRNASRVVQRALVLFGTARAGARIVAAGRGLVTRLAPGKSARFHIYFIGNPHGARVTVAAPPSNLG
jgi:hypothetical protein